MTVYFVGAGPGDPDLLTQRAARLLEQCPICIYTGSLVPLDVIELARKDAERYDSSGLTLAEIVEIIIQAHHRGLDVVRLHTGDPSLYGAIGEQMRELDALCIPHQVVPGISAFQAAAAALQCELTAPEVSQTVILSRISGRTPVPQEQSLDKLAATQSTLCLFLSVHRIDDLVAELTPHYGADCPAAVVYRASWPDQQILKGTLSDIAALVHESKINKTALIVVGWALATQLPNSRLYDPGFTHGYRSGEDT